MVSQALIDLALEVENGQVTDQECARQLSLLGASEDDLECALRRCVLCGERGADAEMYGPARHGFRDRVETNGLVHAQCGLSAGWEVS